MINNFTTALLQYYPLTLTVFISTTNSIPYNKQPQTAMISLLSDHLNDVVTHPQQLANQQCLQTNQLTHKQHTTKY